MHKTVRLRKQNIRGALFNVVYAFFMCYFMHMSFDFKDSAVKYSLYIFVIIYELKNIYSSCHV